MTEKEVAPQESEKLASAHIPQREEKHYFYINIPDKKINPNLHAEFLELQKKNEITLVDVIGDDHIFLATSIPNFKYGIVKVPKRM